MNARIRPIGPGMRRRISNDAGMSLLETLGYVAVLAVLVNLTLTLFIGASRLSILGTTALDRLRMVEDVREGFSETVREARRVVSGVGAYETGPGQLVLELPPDASDGDARRYAVLGHITSALCLGRLEVVERGGVCEASSYSTYALPIAGVRFEYDSEHLERVRLVTLQLDAQNAAKTKAPATYRFQASLRGSNPGAATREAP